MSEESHDVETPAAVALLQNRRRVHLLECLHEHAEPVSLPDLADEIAVRECGTELTEIDPEHVKEIYLSLYHTHVPKLEDGDFLQYEQEQDLVSTPPEVDLEAILADAGRIAD